MRQILYITAVVVVIVSIVSLIFTFRQASQEELMLTADLQYRTRVLTDSLLETVERYFLRNSTSSLQNVVNKFTDKERLAGIIVYDNNGNIVAASEDLSGDKLPDNSVIAGVMDGNQPSGVFLQDQSGRLYFFSEPMHDDNELVVGAISVVQRADYIGAKVGQIWKNGILRLLLQVLVVAGSIFVLIRWFLFKPIIHLAESIKMVRSGQTEDAPESSSYLLSPLTSEITKLSTSLVQARLAASEEARMRLQKIDTPWTSERLKEFISIYLKNRPIFVVSNREPYIHFKVKNEMAWRVPASGMVTALEPIMEACGGTWIACGSGDADKLTVDQNDKVRVPPEEPKYTLKRIWLSRKEEKGYYHGFSNEALYLLSLMTHTRPVFRKEDWEEYRRVNGKFAKAVLSEIEGIHKPFILVQDYHLALLPKMIKKSRPDSTVSIFWHIPWVSPENFSICPWRKEILEGMLGADLIGFHTQLYCNNFIETVGRELECLIDYERFTVTKSSHISAVKSFPASVTISNNPKAMKQSDLNSGNVLKNLGVDSKYAGLGVDRLDFAKGILEKFKGIEIFLKTHPKFRGNFSFVQIAVPSRTENKNYQNLKLAVENETERINGSMRAGNWKPIYLLEKHYTHKELNELYRAANFCLVTPVHDGMNLVAKEFVSARDDEQGVLILSQFAGASREFKEALIVNPYSGEQTAEAIRLAMEMPATEQKRRIKNLRGMVRNYNVFRWSAEILKAMADLT